MTDVPILCGSCKSPVEIPTDAQDDYQFVCSGCGQSDRLDDIARIASDYFVDRAGKGLSDSLARATRGNKFVKFKAKPTPRRTFRWISG